MLHNVDTKNRASETPDSFSEHDVSANVLRSRGAAASLRLSAAWDRNTELNDGCPAI